MASPGSERERKRKTRATTSGAHGLVQTLAHLFTRLEKRHHLFDDRHLISRARIASGSRGALFRRKSAKSAQFDPLTPRETGSNLIEDSVDDVFNIALIEMGIARRHSLYKFGFNQRNTPIETPQRSDATQAAFNCRQEAAKSLQARQAIGCPAPTRFAAETPPDPSSQTRWLAKPPSREGQSQGFSGDANREPASL